MLLNILIGAVVIIGVALVWMALDSKPDPSESGEAQALQDAYRWN